MKTLTASEKVEKSVRESDFTFREINQESPKRLSWALLIFKEKKKAAYLHSCSYQFVVGSD